MKFRIKTILYYFIIAFTILSSSVEWRYIIDSNYPVFGVKVCFLVSVVAAIVLNSWRITIYRNTLVTFCYIILVLILYAACSGYNISSYILNFVLYIGILFWFYIVLYQNEELGIFFDTFSNVVCIICSVSLFFWLFGSVLDVLPGRQHVYYHWANADRSAYTYFNLYFENVVQNQKLLGLQIPRNCGIFTEVPAFAEYIIYALLIELFFINNKRIRKIRVFLLISTVISTQSTKALVLLIILGGLMFFFLNESTNSLFKRTIKIILSIGIACSAFWIIRWIIVDKANTSSFIVRMSDLTAAITAWRKNLLFGVGYNNNSAVNMFSTVTKNNNGLSMGIAVLLAEGGLYMFMFFVEAFLLPFLNPMLKRKKYFIFAIVIIMNLFISNSWMTIPYLFMVSSGYGYSTLGNRFFSY